MKLITPQADPYSRNGRKTHHRLYEKAGVKGFVGVDGEGVTGPDGIHRYVLLGCGEDQIEDPQGLHWSTILSWLYERYKPRTAFCLFYATYDFTQIIKTMPEDRAWRLLTHEGKESRRSRSPKLKGRFLPVDIDEWQVDVIGSKRLSFRWKPCDCETVKCRHERGPWMYLCDVGPFFQTGFLNVIDPSRWAEPPCTEEEYEIIKEGKQRRETAGLDDDMRFYNLTENRALVKVMEATDKGLKRIDVRLSAQQWFGPGQAAQKWLDGKAPKTEDLKEAVPEWFLEAARASYFGGWFEIMAHGIIPGVSHEYDINSAYPAVIAGLPCLLHGDYSRGSGAPKRPGEGLCLVRALVWGHSPYSHDSEQRYIGAMLHRDTRGRITRPLATEGWFWWHELEAARRAGLITRIAKDRIYEWVKYEPCDCEPPLASMAGLYDFRLEVGKDSPQGKGARLVYNSAYGKTAQSVGHPVFGNPVYASLITAGTRAQICDAIATHPKGVSNVLMVATDAVYFLDAHPLLACSTRLGEWEHKERSRLTLFKPGVYWDDAARQAILEGKSAAFKARGVNAQEFSKAIAQVDAQFEAWNGSPPHVPSGLFDDGEANGADSEWPRVTFRAHFAMVSCLQALQRHNWRLAGTIDRGEDGKGKEYVQSANPEDKRAGSWYDTSDPDRPIYRTGPRFKGANATFPTLYSLDTPVSFKSIPYEKRFGLEDPFSDESIESFGITPDDREPLRGAFRVLIGEE